MSRMNSIAYQQWRRNLQAGDPVHYREPGAWITTTVADVLMNGYVQLSNGVLFDGEGNSRDPDPVQNTLPRGDLLPVEDTAYPYMLGRSDRPTDRLGRSELGCRLARIDWEHLPLELQERVVQALFDQPSTT